MSASIRPNLARAVSTIRAAVFGSPMSPSTSARSSDGGNGCALVMLRELATTRQPRFENASTIPAPIPCEAPVTITVFCMAPDPRLQDLLDDVDRAAGANLAGADRQELIQEGVPGSRRLEAGKGTEVVAPRGGELPTTERRLRFRAVVTQPLERHVDQRVVIRPERDPQVGLEDPVRAQDGPVVPAGEDAAAESRAFELAVCDGKGHPHAVWPPPELLRGGRRQSQRHERA